ncbi:hypothetical protein BMETH_526_1 [methanotrophic bacterial endosymbiont of Bathymodiolus sp.]|nr:hypothetical protein BMETH_526_1 [methanotrophic bacterial endosymbiont of Bathymodiolus sp.]
MKNTVSATILTKQWPYAFWGLPALAFALHGWLRKWLKTNGQFWPRIIGH